MRQHNAYLWVKYGTASLRPLKQLVVELFAFCKELVAYRSAAAPGASPPHIR
jgi:hypothetical protein